MASRKNQRQMSDNAPRVVMQPKSGPDTLGLATLAGVVAVLMISFSTLRALDNLEERIEDKLDQVEDRLAQAGRTQIQAQATPAAADTPPPRRSGPDPERTYPIKVAGAPSKGAANAPITIAEFSDFQ